MYFLSRLKTFTFEQTVLDLRVYHGLEPSKVIRDNLWLQTFIFKVSESDCLSSLSLTALSLSDLSLPYMTQQIYPWKPKF